MVSRLPPPPTISALALIALDRRRVSCAILDLSSGKVVAQARAPASGIQAGDVMDPAAAHGSFVRAIVDAEQIAGFQADAAVIAVSSGAISLDRIEGDANLDPPIVTSASVARLEMALRTHVQRNGRVCIHSEMLNYRLDARRCSKPPTDRFGRNLAIQAGFVTMDGPPLKRLIDTVEATALPVAAVVPFGLAVALATSTDRERQNGIAVVDIGPDQSIVATFHEGDMTSVASVALGIDHFALELAEATDVSPQIAERIISEHGMHVLAHAGRVDAALRRADSGPISLSSPETSGAMDARSHSCVIRRDALFRHLADRLDAPVAMLPPNASVILTGEGAKVPGLVEHAAHVWARAVRQAHSDFEPAVLGGLAIAIKSSGVGVRSAPRVIHTHGASVG